MFSKAFALAALERAIKTFAQTLAAVLGIGLTDILAVDWHAALSAAGGAAVLSILSSITTGALTDGNPSVGDAEVVASSAMKRREHLASGGIVKAGDSLRLMGGPEGPPEYVIPLKRIEFPAMPQLWQDDGDQS